MKIHSSRVGWAAVKGRREVPESLGKTKRDLLIGYDLMPLRGLRKTERFLIAHGVRLVRCRIVPFARGPFWSVAVTGRISLDFGAWSRVDADYLPTVHTVAGWLSDQLAGANPRDARSLLELHYMLVRDSYQHAADGRKERKYQRLLKEAAVIFHREGVEICRCRMHLESPRAPVEKARTA
jgi:hypothetical protein